MVSLPLQGRTVAITGASGSLGQALLRRLHRRGELAKQFVPTRVLRLY